MMGSSTIKLLLDLNRRFYTDFSVSFTATRRRIQPGVRRVLSDLTDSPADTWLDLGCGSGSLAVEWLQIGRRSAYLGLDFSTSLLQEAAQAVSALPGHERVSFAQADLSKPGWIGKIPPNIGGVLCFAVLHHLPSWNLRSRLVQQVSDLLPSGGRVFL
jgi:tRNA (uracil-5-)-methyltransferase TRM9